MKSTVRFYLFWKKGGSRIGSGHGLMICKNGNRDGGALWRATFLGQGTFSRRWCRANGAVVVCGEHFSQLFKVMLVSRLYSVLFREGPTFALVGETAFIVIERNQRKSPCALLIIIRQRVCIPMLLVYKFNEGFIHNP